MKNKKSDAVVTESAASVYCPICTHSVNAAVLTQKRVSIVKPGQKCSRCAASLDAGRILWLDRAA